MTPQLQKELDALSKEELKELRKRIVAAMPREQIIARMSGTEGMPQEEYDKFVHSQLTLYKQEQTQKREQTAQISG